MPQYWTPVGGLAALPAGIGIADLPAYPTFYADVAAALTTIYAQPVGRALLDALILRRASNKFTTIHPPREGGDRNEAQCRGADNARTLMAKAIGEGDSNSAINMIKLALNVNGHHQDYAWLAQQLNNVPRYALAGAVAAGAGNLGILPRDVERWLTLERPLFHPFVGADLALVQNALQIVLFNMGSQTAGPGAHSVVYWSPTRATLTLSSGVVSARPPYIGLAHELIHAYHNAHGTQLSWSEDPVHSSAVLFEYMCVGLGPWAAATPTENGIRAENAVALRPIY